LWVLAFDRPTGGEAGGRMEGSRSDLPFAEEEYPDGVGVAGAQAGEQCVPAVGGGLGVDRLSIEVPGQGRFPGASPTVRFPARRCTCTSGDGDVSRLAASTPII
jgi:hypothetical protein